MTVIVQGGTATTVVQDRRSRTVVTARPSSTTVADASAALVAVQQPSEVSVGGNVGRRGPQGEAGLSGAGVIAPISFGWGDAPASVYVPVEDGMLVLVRLRILVPFNGLGASIRVGTEAAPESALPAAWIDPYAAEFEIENTPDITLTAGTGVWLAISPGSASQGEGLLFLTFLPL